jgi:hypothetical protein
LGRDDRNKPTRTVGNRVRRDGSTRDQRIEATKLVLSKPSITDVYASAKGRKFGSWIDADSRSNGYNQNDLIENPAYIVESIWRDELGLGSNSIDFASVDAVGNTTNGTRKDWKFARSINAVENSVDIVRRMCYESHLCAIKTHDGKRRLIALDTNPSTPYVIEQNQMSRKPLISWSHHSFIRNQFNVGYAYNYATGAFEKSIVVDENKCSFEEGTDMISNYHFEANITGWNASGFTDGIDGAVFARNTTTPIAGTGDLHWKANASKTGYKGIRTDAIQFTAGKRYHLKFTYRKVGSTNVNTKFSKTTSITGDNLGGTVDTALTATSNTEKVITFVATETATAYLFFYDENNTNVGEMYIDNVRLYHAEFDYTSFTPDEESDIIRYGASGFISGKSLCFESQSRYSVKNRMEENLMYVYDDATAIAWTKKTVEWRYAPHLILDIAGWWGDTESASRKPLILYEHGDQCYVSHPLLDGGISSTYVFMVTKKIIYKTERLVRLILTSMR